MMKAKKSTSQPGAVSDELQSVMSELGVSETSTTYDYSKYFPMLDEVRTDFANSMRLRIKSGGSLSDKMVAALDSMLVNWKNKPDYSKYLPMLNAVKQTDFTVSMKDCIARGGILTEGMTQALDAMLSRWEESKKPIAPTKPSKIEVMVKVRRWMTTDKFDRPLPVMEMEGEVLEETSKMVRVRLQGSGRPSSYCRHCGRDITHPVSLYYGLGPKCGEHYHIDIDGMAEDNYKAIRAQLEKLLWEGWLPKSQITVTPIEDLPAVELPELPKTSKSKKAGA